MAEEKIGIKLADGSFYPILSAQDSAKKRVTLTTASNEEERAQIDLYRSHGDATEDASYVGSVILEDLAPAGEEREIELVLGLDEKGTLSARATENASGTYQSLSVSLDSVAEEDRLELPDFDEEFEEDLDEDLDEELDLDSDLFDQDLESEFGSDLEEELASFDEGGEAPGEEDLFAEEEAEERIPPRRFSPIVLLVVLLVSLALLAALTYGVFKLLESEPIPPLRAYFPFLVIAFEKTKRSAAD